MPSLQIGVTPVQPLWKYCLTPPPKFSAVTSVLSQTKDDTEVNEPKDVNDIYPFAPRKRYPENFCRTYPEYRSKLPDFGCVLRIRSAASHAVHDFFLKRFSSKF